MWGNPDADIMRDIVQLLRERIKQGLLTVLMKIKAHRGDPLNELAEAYSGGLSYEGGSNYYCLSDLLSKVE